MSTEPKRATLADYKGRERHVRVARWPGLSREVGVMRLVCSEIQASDFAARELFNRQRLRTTDNLAKRSFLEEVNYQLTYRMLIAPDSKRAVDRICRNVEELKELLEPDEVMHFIELHQRMQLEQISGWAETPAFDRHLRQIGQLAGCSEDATADQIVARIKEHLSA